MSRRPASAVGVSSRPRELAGRVLVSLLVLCAVLVGVTTPAAAATKSGVLRSDEGRGVTASSTGEDTTWDLSRSDPRCESTSPLWQRMDKKKRPHGPAAGEEAGPQRVLLDCPPWIPPAVWSVLPPTGMPEGRGDADSALGEAPHRTFDGRAPPLAGR